MRQGFNLYEDELLYFNLQNYKFTKYAGDVLIIYKYLTTFGNKSMGYIEITIYTNAFEIK